MMTMSWSVPLATGLMGLIQDYSEDYRSHTIIWFYIGGEIAVLLLGLSPKWDPAEDSGTSR